MNTDKTTSDTSNVAQLEEIVGKAEELLKSLGDGGDSAAHALRQRVTGTIRDARARLGSLADQTIDMKSTAMASTQGYARANPWTVVAMAAAIGLAIGALAARRG